MAKKIAFAKDLSNVFENRASVADISPGTWDSWRVHLAKRETPIHLREIIPTKKQPPLLWAFPAGSEDRGRSESRSLIANLDRIARGKKKEASVAVEGLAGWLKAAQIGAANGDEGDSDLTFALECLAWAYALPQLAKKLPADTWCETLGTLLKIVEQAEALSAMEQPLVAQLLSGELAWTLGYLFPEIKTGQRLSVAGRDVVSTGIKSLLDGDGLPHGANLSIAHLLLACWTRCAFIARSERAGQATSKKKPPRGSDIFNAEATTQYDWFVRRVLQLTREDGSAVLSSELTCDKKIEGCETLFDAALLISDDPEDGKIASQILPWRKVGRKTTSAYELPEPAVHSEWAEVAILRSSWLRGSTQMIVNYANRQCKTELSIGDRTLWSGAWNPVIEVDGKTIASVSGWEETCWHSDDDVDYLELEIHLEKSWRIQRQVLLAREDRFLFTADALLGEKQADVRYQCSLPLTPNATCTFAEATHEVTFSMGKKHHSLVLPLSLPEWRENRSNGMLQLIDRLPMFDLSAETGQQYDLKLSQHAKASRLYAAMFIDLNSQRTPRQFTWRRLTVGHDLEIQPADVASAYRVQIDDEQWLFYRSLAPAAPRTVLGQHLAHEFYASRFDYQGETEELIGIDAS